MGFGLEDEGLAGLLGHADEALLEVAHLVRVGVRG